MRFRNKLECYHISLMMTQVNANREQHSQDAPAVMTSSAADAGRASGGGLLLLPVAISLALYLRTLAPDLLPGDPGEFQFAAWRLGLAHATGYPLYLLLGWAWQHALAVVGVNPAAALNAFSALAASAGVGLFGLLLLRWTRPVLGERAAGVAVYGALLLAVNLTFWSQALIAEVYALHVVFMVLLWLAVHRFAAQPSGRRLLGTATLAGLALTHHAMTLLLLPALALYWVLARDRAQRIPPRAWAAALVAAALPLLLYLYIPLRSGPDASPWYHQPLGDSVLQLYGEGWDAFTAFISGRSISVGFREPGDAWQQVGQAAWLWHYHFGWVGLVMMALGLVWLAATGRRALLVATLLYALLQQGFNLFYNIGDILVYYIPLYLTGAIWAACGLTGLISGVWSKTTAAPPAPGRAASVVGWVAAGALILLVLRDAPATAAAIDQSESRGARTRWEAILAAEPPPGAILISNDRDEMVPLFYLQAVEGRGIGLTALFPLIAPDARFRDLGATVETALAARGGPVYLIKPMPGLDVRFTLEPATAPLVRVTGPAALAPPSHSLDAEFGPLRLLGVDIVRVGSRLEVTAHWEVLRPVDGDYTATAQWLAGDDAKLAQHDHPAGGVYYPTSLWKVGEHLRVRHTLVAEGAVPAQTRLLLGMYRPTDLAPLAPPVILPLDVATE